MNSFATSFIDTIPQSRSIFNIQEDLNFIDSINTKIDELGSIRNNTENTHRGHIAQLERSLNQVKASISTLKSSSDTKSNKGLLFELESEMFQILNKISQLTKDISTIRHKYSEDLNKLESLEAKLQQLKESNFATQNVHGSDYSSINEKSKIIKLKLYESLGLKFNEQEILILSKKGNKTNVVKIDDSYSSYFVSNLVWDDL